MSVSMSLIIVNLYEDGGRFVPDARTSLGNFTLFKILGYDWKQRNWIRREFKIVGSNKFMSGASNFLFTMLTYWRYFGLVVNWDMEIKKKSNQSIILTQKFIAEINIKKKNIIWNLILLSSVFVKNIHIHT